MSPALATITTSSSRQNRAAAATRTAQPARAALQNHRVELELEFDPLSLPNGGDVVLQPNDERHGSMSLDVLDPRAYRQTELGLVEQLAFRHGRSYDAYLALEAGREFFWSQSGQGVVAYVRVGRYLQIGGGLLAPAEHKPQLLAELIDFAQAERLIVSFFNVDEADLPVFRECGFQVTKWGEEAVVDLAGQTWQGKAFEWVRRQANYCRRQRVRFSECRRETLSAREWQRLAAEIKEIAGDAPDDKPQAGEIKFLQGSLDLGYLGRKRIFIARSQTGNGRLEGFLIANPGQNGQLWAFEIFRHRPDAVRGTMAFLMHETMQQMAGEGVEHVSLCLAPGLNCGQPMTGDSPLVRRGMMFGTQYCSFIFDAAGLYHFKSRFRPRFEGRYLCVSAPVTLGWALAFMRLTGVLRLDPGKTCRLAWDRLRKWAPRRQLARRQDAAPATAE